MRTVAICGALVLSFISQRFLTAPDVLTTGLKSAVMDVPYLDEEAEPFFQPLSSLEREADGTFVLRPGAFEMTFESFCLLPGTHGPAGGDGFLFAPLAGRGAVLIQAVLDRSAQHPGMPQEHIQQLLWAILAQARFADLDGDVKQAAAALLTPREIAQLEGYSGDMLRDRLRDELLDRAPGPVRPILTAHDQLRTLLADASSSYEQMREVAVLDGRPEPQQGDREIPEGRWNYHPDGYFIRFASSHFSQTRVQLLVPRGIRAALVRDAKGRIVRATYPEGFIVEAEYDDTIPALTVPGDPELRGYAFKRLRYSAAGQSAEIDNRGWTFVGRSNGRGDAGGLPSGEAENAGNAGEAGFAGEAGLAGPFVAADQDGWKQRYERAKERYGKWKDLQGDAADRRAREERDRRGPSGRDADDVTDEGHYRDGYDKAKGGDLGEKLKWIQDQKRREQNAAEYIHCRLQGGCDGADDPPTKTPPRRRGWKPSGGAAVPGAQGGQRLGIGARGAR